MRAVVQRVSQARVTLGEPPETTGEIERGLLILLGVGHEDDEATADAFARKIAQLRIFEDDDGKMNLDVAQAGGQVLVVSQFTLYGDCRKGRRPSFVAAGPPDRAAALVERFIQAIRDLGLRCETGRFQATMDVSLVNHGPVTLLLDSDKTF